MQPTLNILALFFSSAVAAPSRTTHAACQDTPWFKDEDGFACAAYSGVDCVEADKLYGISGPGLARLLENCPATCGFCDAKPLSSFPCESAQCSDCTEGTAGNCRTTAGHCFSFDTCASVPKATECCASTIVTSTTTVRTATTSTTTTTTIATTSTTTTKTTPTTKLSTATNNHAQVETTLTRIPRTCTTAGTDCLLSLPGVDTYCKVPVQDGTPASAVACFPATSNEPIQCEFPLTFCDEDFLEVTSEDIDESSIVPTTTTTLETTSTLTTILDSTTTTTTTNVSTATTTLYTTTKPTTAIPPRTLNPSLPACTTCTFGTSGNCQSPVDGACFDMSLAFGSTCPGNYQPCKADDETTETSTCVIGRCSSDLCNPGTFGSCRKRNGDCVDTINGICPERTEQCCVDPDAPALVPICACSGCLGETTGNCIGPNGDCFESDVPNWGGDQDVCPGVYKSCPCTTPTTTVSTTKVCTPSQCSNRCNAGTEGNCIVESTGECFEFYDCGLPALKASGVSSCCAEDEIVPTTATSTLSTSKTCTPALCDRSRCLSGTSGNCISPLGECFDFYDCSLPELQTSGVVGCCAEDLVLSTPFSTTTISLSTTQSSTLETPNRISTTPEPLTTVEPTVEYTPSTTATSETQVCPSGYVPTICTEGCTPGTAGQCRGPSGDCIGPRRRTGLCPAGFELRPLCCVEETSTVTSSMPTTQSTTPSSTTSTTMSSTMTPRPNPCTAGHWAHSEMIEDGSWICYSIQKLTWEAAQNECVAIEGQLPSVHSWHENLRYAKLRSARQSRKPTWLGGTVAGGRINWNDGSKHDYDRWYSAEPSGPDGECLAMGSRLIRQSHAEGNDLWNDADCTARFNSFCVIPPVTKINQPSPDTAPVSIPLWKVVAGECQVSADGRCVSDGSGYAAAYTFSQICTVKAAVALIIDVEQYAVEGAGFDYVTVNGNDYNTNGVGPDGVVMTADDEFTWVSDRTIQYAGWTFCADPVATRSAERPSVAARKRARISTTSATITGPPQRQRPMARQRGRQRAQTVQRPM